MKEQKEFYHSKTLRHIVKKEGCALIATLQRKSGWFWHAIRNRSNIHFEIREDFKQAPEGQQQRIRINPMVLRFQRGGHTEIWDESTFDLKKRLTELAEEYLQAVGRFEKKSKIMGDQLA